MEQADNRAEGRSNVFLAAILHTGPDALPVRIRNIAAGGVLVEAPSLPPVGTRVRLVRGKLSATGELAWDGAGQCGITFDDPIRVDDWVRRVGHAGQQRVDRLVASVRDTGDLPGDRQGPDRLVTLPEISAALDDLCDRLAGTPQMSLELGENLVKLDTIAQALRRVATGRAY